MLNMIILPRQARDKHRGKLKKRGVAQADIDLHAHPLFTDMKLCTACLLNYNEDENWRLGPEHKEENCRICGYDDASITMCDETACRHSFCQGCVSIHTEKYGIDEFVSMHSNLHSNW
eukprot:COSAG06_NODE_3706_length_4994_cov_5.256588_3_plen_118_part_00